MDEPRERVPARVVDQGEHVDDPGLRNDQHPRSDDRRDPHAARHDVEHAHAVGVGGANRHPRAFGLGCRLNAPQGCWVM